MAFALFKKKESPEKPSGQAAEEAAKSERILLEEEKIYRRGIISVRDIIAPESMKVEPTFIVLGDKFVRTIFIMTYPRYINIGWFAPIINLNVTLDVAMYFYPVKSEIILKQLKKKVGALEAQIISDSEKGAPRDPIRETALRDIEKLRDDLTQGVEHFFQFALYITIYADSKEALDNISEDVESLFGGKLIYSKKFYIRRSKDLIPRFLWPTMS
ncbi:MAG: hypothetical protein PHD51_02535 [Patescibacteria group bacterium]|nr:hypothetical protein [Patescibacteria group bacterium]